MFPCGFVYRNTSGFGTVESGFFVDGGFRRTCHCDCNSTGRSIKGRTLDLRQHGTRKDGWIEAGSVVFDNSGNRQAQRTVFPFVGAAAWVDEWTAETPTMLETLPGPDNRINQFFLTQQRNGYQSANSDELDLSDPYLLWYTTVNGQILYDVMPKNWDESSTDSSKFAYYTSGIPAGDTITIKWFVNESLVDMKAFETTFTRGDQIVVLSNELTDTVDRTISWKFGVGGKTYLFSDPLIDITPDPNSKDNYEPGKDYRAGEETFKYISIVSAKFTVTGLGSRENFVTQGSDRRGFDSDRPGSPFIVDERSLVRWIEVPVFYKNSGIKNRYFQGWFGNEVDEIAGVWLGRPPGELLWTDFVNNWVPPGFPYNSYGFESAGELGLTLVDAAVSVNGHQMVPLVPDDGLHGDTVFWFYPSNGQERFLYKKNPMIEQFGHPCIGPTVKETSGFQLP